METWPNFFIVGAPKAGTSSLYAYLKDIPGIYMSPIKEPNYFSAAIIPATSSFGPIRDKKKYLSLFEKVKDEKIIGEASPSYLSDPEAPKLIHEIVPDARILISLRDPVERAYSNYLMYKRLGWLQDSFHNELQKAKLEKNSNIGKLILQRGLYTNNVKRYFDVFGQKQVKVIIFEEMFHDVKSVLNDVLEFLGVTCPLNDFESKVHNPYATVRGPIAGFVLKNKPLRRLAEKIMSPNRRRALKEKLILKPQTKPKLNEKDRNTLIDFYREDVVKIQTLLDRDLPWKNFDKL